MQITVKNTGFVKIIGKVGILLAMTMTAIMVFNITADVPEKAFITAWNHLVDEYECYVAKWQQTIEIGDELQRYRMRKLKQLVEETGNIDTMSY